MVALFSNDIWFLFIYLSIYSYPSLYLSIYLYIYPSTYSSIQASLYQFKGLKSHSRLLVRNTNTNWTTTLYTIKGIILFTFKLLCMPSTLAPDPIRVQSCVCCLYWTNRNSMAVTSIFLSISLSKQSYESVNRLYNSKWKYLLLLKL